MVEALLGKKIGMTQVFDEKGNVVPVTVVDCANWYVTQIKTHEKDGYSALQLGLLKKKYEDSPFESEWLKAKPKYFVHVKEIPLIEGEHDFQIGQELSFKDVTPLEGQKVKVIGKSRGLGFQGVIKRWGFSRGPETHGSSFHRSPGAMGNLCREGKVDKGKKLPGHMGFRQITMQGLKIVKTDEEKGCLFIKGAVPGKKNMLLMIKKQG